jgi:glycosyltransferase involved in cell wall biosynthesis
VSAHLKVAIAYDWLNQFGGGERVLMELKALFPSAPIYTTVHSPEHLPAAMRAWDIRTSFLQRLPFARTQHRPFFPLMPVAFEQFDMSGYDLVISASSACAKGVIPAVGALNICYCYSPCRYLWDSYDDYVSGLPLRGLVRPVARRMRAWDRRTSTRVDRFFAISEEVAARIRRHYDRDSEVIYPPVHVDRFALSRSGPEDFYLVVSRLVRYKRIDLAIAAANRLRRRLVIVGDGPQRRRLEAVAGPTIEFLGRRPDPEVADLYARCRAFLFPGFDDFGIAPVEAQAAGRPVIAFGRGGATETVVEGVTGRLFQEQQVDAVIDAMLALERAVIDPQLCRRNAERFAAPEFRRRFQAAIARELSTAGDAVTPPCASDALVSAGYRAPGVAGATDERREWI